MNLKTLLTDSSLCTGCCTCESSLCQGGTGNLRLSQTPEIKFESLGQNVPNICTSLQQAPVPEGLRSEGHVDPETGLEPCRRQYLKMLKAAKKCRFMKRSHEM